MSNDTKISPPPLSVAVVASFIVALLLTLGEQLVLGFAPLSGGGAGAFLLLQFGVYLAFSLLYGLGIAAFLGGLRRTVALGPAWKRLVDRIRSDEAADVHLTATLLSIGASVLCVVAGFLVIYGGKDPEFLAKPKSAGPFFAFFVLVLVVVGAGAFFPLHVIATKVLRLLRAPSWLRSERFPLTLRVVAGVVGLGALGAAAILIKLMGNYEMRNVLRFPLFLLIFVLLHAGIMALVWRLRGALAGWLGRAGVIATAVVTLGVASVPFFGLGAFPEARDRIESDAFYEAKVASILRGVFDVDRDGFSWVLDGGDCDDFNCAVSPDAEEVAGDGLDNDCRDGDAKPGEEKEFALDPELMGDSAAATAAADQAAKSSSSEPEKAASSAPEKTAEGTTAEGVKSAAGAGGAEGVKSGGGVGEQAATAKTSAKSDGAEKPASTEAVGATAVADAAAAEEAVKAAAVAAGVDRKLLEDSHLIVVLIDTVRADHVHYYGYERETTPNLDAFCKESVVFKRAYAQANHTPRSMPSIFTGLFPSEIKWDKLYRNFSPIKKSNVTLFEILREHGFTNVGVFQHWYFEKERRLDQGFHIWDNRGAKSLADGNTISPAPSVTKRALKHFEKLHKDGKRIASFVHYMDPHSRYMKHSRMKVFGGNKTLMDKYDGEIYWTDHYVGKLFDGMKEMGIYDNSVIIVLGDHGEAFKDHKSYFHGMTLYREEIEVPLIVKIPGVEQRDVDERVALVDVFPTALDLFQISYDGHHQGVSLVDTGVHGKPRGKPVYSELCKYPSWKEDIRALYVGDLKIIWNKTKNHWELFDLAVDPTEQKNVFRTHPKAEAMKKALHSWMDTQLKRK